ncbi:MAG: menaquinone biosynthesis protein [Candidatus Omnitrophica bacterium]|nr:menaquinone biosynthesis protein [Candidatus Omnitrophota bacterium]
MTPSLRPASSLTKTRVAQVPFLNCLPFYAHWEPDASMELVDLSPRQLGTAALQGHVDAGPMAVADFLRQSDRFERLGHLGIATGKEAMSVLLFSQRPLWQLAGEPIGITEQTSTSGVLLRLILESRHNVLPARYVVGARHDVTAVLVIGDEALAASRGELATRYPFITDLGAEWWQWQALPSVFAVWTARKTLPEAERKSLTQSLSASVVQSLRHLPELATPLAGALHRTPAELQAYLEAFTYRLTPFEERGLERFRQLATEQELL